MEVGDVLEYVVYTVRFRTFGALVHFMKHPDSDISSVLWLFLGLCGSGCLPFIYGLVAALQVNPGNDCPTKVSAEEVAKYTIQTMMRGVPGAMPGIHFLSGGMSDAEATANLQLLNTLEEGKGASFAWNFSYGRALQIAVLKLWAGDDAKKDEAQALLTKLARANSMAQQGKFSGEHPSPGGSARNWQPLRLV